MSGLCSSFALGGIAVLAFSLAFAMLGFALDNAFAAIGHAPHMRSAVATIPHGLVASVGTSHGPRP